MTPMRLKYQSNRNQTHRVSGPLVTGLVVTGMVAVSVGLYAVQGAPELIELEKAQHVLSG